MTFWVQEGERVEREGGRERGEGGREGGEGEREGGRGRREGGREGKEGGRGRRDGGRGGRRDGGRGGRRDGGRGDTQCNTHLVDGIYVYADVCMFHRCLSFSLISSCLFGPLLPSSGLLLHCTLHPVWSQPVRCSFS